MKRGREYRSRRKAAAQKACVAPTYRHHACVSSWRTTQGTQLAHATCMSTAAPSQRTRTRVDTPSLDAELALITIRLFQHGTCAGVIAEVKCCLTLGITRICVGPAAVEGRRG